MLRIILDLPSLSLPCRHPVNGWTL